MLYEDENTTDSFVNSIDVRFNNHPTALNNQTENFRWGAFGPALHGLKYEDKLWLNATNNYVFVDNINNRISMFNGDIQPLRATWKNPNVYLANRNVDAVTEDTSNKIVFYHYDLITVNRKGTDPSYTNPLVNVEWGGFWKYQTLERELQYLNWFYSPRVGIIYRIYGIKSGFVANSNNRYFQIKYEVQDAVSRANNIANPLKTFYVEVDESLICGNLDFLNEGKYLVYNNSQYTYSIYNDRYINNKYNLPYRLTSIKLDGSSASLAFYQFCPAISYQRNIVEATGDYYRLKIHQNESIESSILALVELVPSENINDLTLSFSFNQILKSLDNEGEYVGRDYSVAYTTPQGQPAINTYTYGQYRRFDTIFEGNSRYLKFEEQYRTGVLTQGQDWYIMPEYEQMLYYDAIYSYKENTINDIYLPYIYKHKAELTYNSAASTPPDRTMTLEIGFRKNNLDIPIFNDVLYSTYEIQMAILNIGGVDKAIPQYAYSKLSSNVGVYLTRDGTGTVNYRKFVYFYRICNYAWVLLTVETFGTDESIISGSDLATWKVYKIDGTLLETITMNNTQMQAAFGNGHYNGSQQYHEFEYWGQSVYAFNANTLPNQTCVRFACLVDWFGSYDPVNERWSGLQLKPCVWV